MLALILIDCAEASSLSVYYSLHRPSVSRCYSTCSGYCIAGYGTKAYNTIVHVLDDSNKT